MNNPTRMSMMMVVVIAALLGVVAAESQKSVKDFEIELRQMNSPVNHEMASHLGAAMWLSCRNKEVPDNTANNFVFAQKLGDEGSDEYKCSAKELEKGEFVLEAAIKHADPQFVRFDETDHFKRIRHHSFSQKGEENIQKFAEIAINNCKEALKTEPFFAAALEANVVAGSAELSNGLRRLNGCKVLVRNGISKEAMVRLSKYAVEHYKDAKGGDRQNVRRMKENYRNHDGVLKNLFASSKPRRF